MSKNRPTSYFLDKGLPLSDYYKQYNSPISLEVGKTYRQPGAVYYRDYKIVFVGEGVALGVEVSNGNGNFNLGHKGLFYAEGHNIGWKYQDNRPPFRLEEEI